MTQYKLYKYELADKRNFIIGPDRHIDLFDRAKGPSVEGEYARYRGKNDAVLMYVRNYRSDFAGQIGRHATEREITSYNFREDETEVRIEIDDDYPNTPFMCFPRLGYIACIEGRSVSANSAMSRLHAILAHRTETSFVVDPVREAFDLRKATQAFEVHEVNFEVNPVNPHTGDLGAELDHNKMLDHVNRLRGTATAKPGDKLQLNGGILTSIQQLQQSGHATAGYRGRLGNVEVIVQRPSQARELGDEEDATYANTADIKVNVERKVSYPFEAHDFSEMRAVINRFVTMSAENG